MTISGQHFNSRSASHWTNTSSFHWPALLLKDWEPRPNRQSHSSRVRYRSAAAVFLFSAAANCLADEVVLVTGEEFHGVTVPHLDSETIIVKICCGQTLTFKKSDVRAIRFMQNNLAQSTPAASGGDVVILGQKQHNLSSEVLSGLRGRGSADESAGDAPPENASRETLVTLSEQREFAPNRELQVTYNASYFATSAVLARERTVSAGIQVNYGFAQNFSAGLGIGLLTTEIRQSFSDDGKQIGPASSSTGTAPLNFSIDWRIPFLSTQSRTVSSFASLLVPLERRHVDATSTKPFRGESYTRAQTVGFNITQSLDVVSVFGGAGLRWSNSPSAVSDDRTKRFRFEVNSGYVFQTNDEFATYAALNFGYTKASSNGTLVASTDRVVLSAGVTYRLAKQLYLRPVVEWGLLSAGSANAGFSLRLTQTGLSL